MNWYNIQKYLKIPADGIPGILTAREIAKALKVPENDWKSIQKKLEISADGIPGATTAIAVAHALGITEKNPVFTKIWPTQSQVRSNHSLFGSPGKDAPLVSIELPYPMKLSWDTSTKITKISCHKLVAEPVRRIFKKAFNHYGSTRIIQMGLDLYGGCFNDRKTIGGASKSMHAWGIAIDLDPDHNELKTHTPQAKFSSKEYIPFWEIVEEEGGVSLGRLRDYDWMHFQFARFD